MITVTIVHALTSQNTSKVSDTYKALFNQQAEQDSIANLTKWLEHLGPQVRILNHVIQLSQVVAEYTCNKWKTLHVNKITSGQSNLTRTLAVTHGCIHQVAPMCTQSSTPQLASRPYWCCPLLNCFEYIDYQTYPRMSQAGPFSPSKLPIHTWGSKSDLIYGSLGPPKFTPTWHLDRFSSFCTAHDTESLYFHLQNYPFAWGTWNPIPTWFVGSTQSTSQMASRSVQPFSQGSQSWQTDRPSVATDHI